MNKRCFRLIFSKPLGFLIPVAETTRAQHKPGQTSSSVASTSSTSAFFSLKRLAASLLLAGLPGWAFAELVVDPAGGRETNVISAPNGLPVIEIANPNGKGLSHNRFTEFDVVKPGVIFNNSQANGVSQLGGAILGNPNLQRQATAILSEVTGNKPSSISGTLEVFGGRADILIANPNGLTVNGVTTLNSSSLTLSTGRAQEVGGQLQLLVDQDSGQVVIGAEGVNTEGLSYFDIVARSVALQGAVGSKAQQTDIQIAAGQGTYDPLTGTFTAKPGAVGSGLAISGSAAGAMYGRYINLISSDSGAGVRHEGLILAAGDIHLSAAGDIELKDAGANGRVDISTTAALTNTGTVAAGKTLTLSTQDLINRKGGYLGTDGDLSIKVLGQLLNEQGATLLATGAMTLNATQSLSNAGGIQAGTALQISTDGTLSNSGMVRSTGLTIKAGSLSNEQGGVLLSNTDASFTVKGDLTNRSGAGIYAQQKLTFDVTGAVLNNAATLAANSLVISAGSLTNQAAAKVLADAGLDLDIKNAVLNDNAVLAAKTLTVKAASLSNQNAAKLVADQSVTLNVVGAVVNNASTLASGNLLSIKSASLDNASSAILAGTTVTLDAADIRNRDSAKLQGTDVSLTAKDRFSNESSASLQASNTLTLDTETFTVTGGEVLAGNDLSLNVGTYKNTGLISSLNTASLSFKNNANLVIDAAFKGPQAANLFTLNAHDVTVTGELNSPGSVLIKATGDVRNQGTVIVGKSLGIEAKGLIDNAPGKLIWAGKNLYLDAGTVLTNGRDSLLMAMGDIALSAGQKVQNNTGRIEAQGDLSIDTPLLENLSSAEGGVSEDSQVKSDTRYTDTYRVFELQYYRVQVSLPTYKSTLSVQQGVVKAGGDLLLNQGTSKGKKATVRNVGGLMAATGNVLVDGNLESRGVSASKSLVDILRAAQTEWRWSNSNGVIYPDGDWVQGTLYSFLDEYLAAGAESRWIKSLKKTSTPGLEQVLSAVLGADWKALEQDTLVQRWADFKANGSDKTQPYYADTQAEISAGQTFLQTGGTFENGDGSNWKEQTPITVKVGSKTVDSLAGELDAQFNLTRDGATDLLKQQLGSPLFQKRESSGDGQAFERVKPLYETRVKYLDQSQFLGSQYFLDKIGYDPQKSVTVLGDAYFDHQLIVQSVEQRVGNFYAQTQRLGGTALVKMLLDNGAALAATEGVSFGQPLTAAQVAALTSDVVWYENQVIDGQTVLAPKLYLSQKTLAARAQDAASSALVSADTVLIDADSVTNFNGTVRGNTDTFVYSKGDINNISLGGAQAGFFAGNGGADGKGPAGQLVIAAEGLVRNQGGVMSGFQQTLVGGKGILSSATTGYDETGALVVRDNGRLGMGLTPDVEKPKEEIPATDPVAQTPPAEKTPLKVEAPKVRDIFEAKLAEGPVDTSKGSSLSLISGGDITLTSAITQADNVLLQTTGNLNLNDLHEARSAYAASHTQGFLSSVNVEERAASANSVGNVLNAKNLTIQAQKDLTITGGEINAQNSDIRVGGNSKVVAGKDLAFYEKAVTNKQLVIGAGVGAGGYEATGLWGTAPSDNSTLPAPFAKQTVVAGSGSVRGDVNVGRAAASQELAKAGSTGATSGANKGRGGTNGANFKIGYEEVTTTDSTESVSYRNAQLNLGSGSVDVGGSLDIGGADINAGYQLSPEARAKMTPEQRAEASKNMPTLAISAGDIKTTKYEDSETTKHTREEFFAGYTAEAHSSVLDVAGNASNLAHKALGKDVVNDPDAPKGSSKTLANEQKAMEVDPALTALAAAGMATQLAFGEAAGVSSTYGIQHTQEEKETSSRAENINQIGGNISLTSTKGDIELNGVNLQGGKVAIKSAGSLTQRAAKSSTTSSESVQTHTAGLTSSAGVSPTGVGTGISVGASGNYDKTESSSTSYTNGLISGTEVSIETKGDHNLIGSNIKGNRVALKIGGNQTITSVQDTSKTDHTRGNWSTSVGVAITTDGLIVPTASASGSGGKDYDDSQLVAEQAGIDADSLDLNVAGNLDLTGAHIVSKPGQGTVKVDGKITANTLHDSREKDGGYGGGGGGISKNGIPTATLEGGRVDQVHYQADNTATIDVGDPSKVTAGQGLDGKLNTDSSKQLDVTENRRVVGTDIKVEISIGDAKEIKAGVKKALTPKAPKVHIADAPTSRTPTSKKTTDIDAPKATPRSYADSDTPAPAIKAKQTFDQHVIVTTDSQKPVVKNAVDNLVAKHPDKSVVVQANADGSVTPIQGELKPGGTSKFEVVGHGDEQSLGGLDGKQISDVVLKLAKDSNTSIAKLALVGCGTACSKDGKSLVNDVSNRLLEGGTNTQVKGYYTAIAVTDQGHKRPVQNGTKNALGKGDPSPDPSHSQPKERESENPVAPKRRWLERAKAEQLQSQGADDQRPAGQAKGATEAPAAAPSRVQDAVAGRPASTVRAPSESHKRSAHEAGLAAGPGGKSSRTMAEVETVQGIQQQPSLLMALFQGAATPSQPSPQNAGPSTQPSSHPGQQAPAGHVSDDIAHLPSTLAEASQPEFRAFDVVPADILSLPTVKDRAFAAAKAYSKLSDLEKRLVRQKDFIKPYGISARYFHTAKSELDVGRNTRQGKLKEAAEAYAKLPVEQRNKMSAYEYALTHGMEFPSLRYQLLKIDPQLVKPKEALDAREVFKSKVVRYIPKDSRKLIYDFKLQEFLDNHIEAQPGTSGSDGAEGNKPSYFYLSEEGRKALNAVGKIISNAKALPPGAPVKHRENQAIAAYAKLPDEAKSMVSKTRVVQLYGLHGKRSHILADRHAAPPAGEVKTGQKVKESLIAKLGQRKPEQNPNPQDLFKKRIMQNLSDDARGLISDSQLSVFFNQHLVAREQSASGGGLSEGRGAGLSFSEDGYRTLAAIEKLAIGAKNLPEHASDSDRLNTARGAYMALPEQAKSLVALSSIETLYRDKSKGSIKTSGDEGAETTSDSVRSGSEQQEQQERHSPINTASMAGADEHIDIEHPPVISLDSDDSHHGGRDPLVSDSPLTPAETDPQPHPSSNSPSHAITDVETADSDWPAQVKLERDDQSSQDAFASRHDPEVMEVSDTEAEHGEANLALKTEPDSPQPAPASEPDAVVADAEVKEELPVIRHTIDNSVPILQDEKGQDILVDALQPPQKSRQTRDLAQLLAKQKLTFGEKTKAALYEQAAQTGQGAVLAQKRKLKEQIGLSARELTLMSGEERAKYFEHWMEVDEVPGKGRGVRAVRDIPPFTVLAPYAGKLIVGEDNINAELGKVGMNFTNYLFGTKSQRNVISAYGDGVGNISSLFNQGNAPEENNLTVVMLGQKLVYFMSERPIKPGEELLYDYGKQYDYSGWPTHPIQVEESESSDSGIE